DIKKKTHPVTNAIDGSERWWQSPPLSSGTQYNKVNVTLDLGQLFHVAYIIIKFANSPRPDLWVLERSVDFGSTYSPWQYFAHSKVDCLEQFGQKANMAISQDDDVLCTTEHSRIVPLENGEIVVSLINGRPGAKNFTFSHTLREFTKATNIRLCFLRTNTLLGHLISKAQRDPTVTRRYYYSIKDISIGGRCVCNGHAEDCNANNPEKLFQCECQHHTCGKTCDSCCAGYNQRPWQPATWELSNECEACNCHGHAIDCYYDPDVERQQASLNIQGVYSGGGVCINCQHNTAGVNCEICAKGYYRPYGVPVDAPNGCIPCSCNPEHADDCEPGSGRCKCKPNFRGDHCEECAVGYYNFPSCLRIPIFPISTPSPEDSVAGDIKGCDCDLEGVLPEICDAYGRCLCRPGVEGPRCDACRLGFYSFPICQACQCSVLGSYQTPCSPVTGQCECQPGITGQQCDRCLSGASDFPHCQGKEDGRMPEGGFLSEMCVVRLPDKFQRPTTGHVHTFYPNLPGCQCDIGGAITPMCSGPSGGCHCREHVVGRACQRPENNYYFPDLHHMKYEIEDGTVPNGRELRFGFDPLEFPEFSWRGYAQMTSVQNQVRIMLNVGKSNAALFHVILKYINPGTEAVSGRVTIYPSWAEAVCCIPPYLCCAHTHTHTHTHTHAHTYISMHTHIPICGCPCVSLCACPWFHYCSRKHMQYMSHPCARALSQVELHLRLRVPQVGHYVVVLEYSTGADQLSVVDVHMQSPGSVLGGQVDVYSCKYSVLCRSVVTDGRSRIAVYELLADADIQLKARGTQFLLHQICIIPIEEFSTEYLRPQVKCIASYGQYVNQSATCASLVLKTPPTALILDVPSGESSLLLPQDPSPSADVTGVTLKAPQVGHLSSVLFLNHGSPSVALTRSICITWELGRNAGLPAHPRTTELETLEGGPKSIPQTASGFCKSSARSLVALYHKGALPCECHPTGAIGRHCSPEGGQCRCRPSVIGRQCTRCRVGYYGFPHCKPCNCGPRLCEETTGRCLCPPHTVRPQCEVCEPHSFSFHPLAGCEGCNCSRRGAIGAATPECDRDHGQCRCKPRVTGRQCDQCASGFYHFPECIPCHCNRDGTEPGVCNPGTGACLCKENVEGTECDVCREGSFYLDPANPKGCTHCFCFGINKRCHSTHKRRAKFVDMMGWSLETADRADIPVSFNPGSSSVVADLQELPSTMHSASWVAHLGRISYKPQNISTVAFMLFFKQGQHMSVIYEEPNNPRPDRLYHVRVQVVEGNFRHASSGAPVSREELMTVLSRLEGVRLRGLYFTETQRLSLSGVGLEEASATGSGRRAHNVEVCACPPGYTGDSCQGCSPGYYRDSKGAYTGRCVPCNCNGHSNRCQDGSGICINCQHNTAGEHCERCKEGHYGNAIHGHCSVCPCPHSNSFSTGCVVTGENVRCSCKPGYTGAQCESCQPCNCNNNGQLGTCHPLTGDCIDQEPKDGSPGEECDGEKRKLPPHPLLQLEEFSLRSVSLVLGCALSRLGKLWGKQREEDVLRSILLKQISGTDGEGNNVPSGDFSREWAKAERMMTELRSHNLGKHLREAEAERREAQLLLNRIRSWLESHQVQNSALVKNIQDALNEYEAKLGDLRAALQAATAQAKQATGLNRENEKTLESIKNAVFKTSSMLLLEYEKLAATLNEERRALSDKVRELSQSASKASLVVEAEMHAQSLQKLAKQLEEIKRNASGDELVRCAVDAATAYENILSAIRAAEDAADKATSASESALQTVIKEELPRKAKILSSDSDKLLKEAKLTQKKLRQEISPALNNLQQTLKVMTVQKGLINTNITAIQDDLRGIQRDDINDMISNAKSMVRNANDITDEVLDGLSPIETDVARIKDTYGSTQSEDLNKALTDADNSVKKLTNKLPDLLSKIESINQQLLPLGNISDNVDRIRELIQQARDAANKVAVPMRFNGKSGVEVRLPNDLDDLKGYTSLSLFLQRPESRESGGTENMFVMYLGNKDASRDYIGMALVDGKLTCVYNLGEQESELQVDQSLTESETQEAVMDRVKFQRIYQFARLNYTKKATSSKPGIPQFHDMDGGNTNTLLNLDPENVVFYVGGYPSDFRLPARLRFPPYKGCIELDDLNENVLSLYNFKKTFNLNTTEVEPCRRRKEESDKNYFEGTGYARVPTQPNAPFPTFGQTIQTTVDRGLLFFAENQDRFISLNIEDGNLLVRYKLNSEPPKEKGVTHTVNNGKDHSIQIKIGKAQKLMWINVNSQKIRIEGEIFDFGTYYLGGIPISIRERSLGFDQSLPPAGWGHRPDSSPLSGTSLDPLGDSKAEPARSVWEGPELPIDRMQGAEESPKFGSGFLFCPHSRLPETSAVLDLASKSTKRGVSLGGCSLNKPPFLMLLRGSARINKPHAFNINQVSVSYTVRAIVHSFESWGFAPHPLSQLQRLRRTLKTSIFLLCLLLYFPNSSLFAVDVQTASSRGLVFYMGTKNSYMALYLSKGRFVFALGAEGKKLRLKSKEKCNDGKWHTVVFGQDGEKGHLVVDGLRAREGSWPGNSTFGLRAPVYLGSPPSWKPKVNIYVSPAHMSCSTSLIVRKMQIKSPMRCHLTLDRKGPGGHGGCLQQRSRKQGAGLQSGMRVWAAASSVMPAGEVEVPSNLNTLMLPVWKSFFGCLKNIQVNHVPIPVTEAMDVQGTVSLNGCPDH
uniref:Laminin subunit alpha 3 n=1 Tax=Suricata suricatta TaxID=37032 RepID=A0A673UW51_SURSU